MYDSYFYYQAMARLAAVSGVGVIIGLILGIVLAITFLPTKKRNKYANRSKLLFLHDFLNFRVMLLGVILKVFYITAAVALSLYGIFYMFSLSFLMGLIILVFGNVILRVLYEGAMLIFSINENLNTLTNHVTGRKNGQIDSDQLLDTMSSKVEETTGKIIPQQETKEQEETKVQEGEQTKKQAVCPKCGSLVTEGSKFCTKCGNPL